MKYLLSYGIPNVIKMPRKQYSNDEVMKYTEELKTLGHIFITFHTYNRVEYKCGNCAESSISTLTLALRSDNENCCYHCDTLKPTKSKTNKYGDEVLGVRDIKDSPKNRTYILICHKCSTRYENRVLYRACLSCSNSTREQTNLTKYGASNVFASKEIKEKIVKSNQERHGVDYPLQNKEIKTKQQTTNIKKYGHKYAFNQPHVYEKIQKTHIENHGAPFPLQSPAIREKMKENSLAKFGTEHPCQNPEELERRFRLMFRLKEYTFPSGLTVDVQGFEDIGLNILLNTYTEDQLITDPKVISYINYTDKALKTRRYTPDILVKESDDSYFYVEIKSLYTYMLNYEKNIAKYTACLEQGIPLMVWIFQDDKQGPIQNLQNAGKRYKLYRHSYIDGASHRFDDGPEASLIPMTPEDYAELEAQKPEKKSSYTLLCRKMKQAQVDNLTETLGAMAI